MFTGGIGYERDGFMHGRYWQALKWTTTCARYECFDDFPLAAWIFAVAASAQCDSASLGK